MLFKVVGTCDMSKHSNFAVWRGLLNWIYYRRGIALFSSVCIVLLKLIPNVPWCGK